MIKRFTICIAVILISVSTALGDELYLASSAGAGTDASPWRHGCAPGAISPIDLRQTTGRDLWICRSASMAGAVNPISLAKALDEQLSAKSRTDIVTTLGKSISVSSRTVPEILKELLVDSGRMLVNKDGKYVIYLGGKEPIWQATRVTYDLFGIQDNGLFADLYRDYIEPAAVLATTLAQETFNCADNAALTCVHTWTETSGTSWAIVSNQANSGVTTSADARNDSTLATANHQISATLAAHTRTGGSFSRCGVFGRKENSGTRTWYGFFADNNATGWELQKRVSNSPTTLGTSTQDPAAGTDVMRIDIDGSSISGYVNNILVVGPITDTDITTFTYGGIVSQADGSAHSCTLDNWNGADISNSFSQKRRVG